MLAISAAGLLVVMLRLFVVHAYTVSGDSMPGAATDGDHVVVNALSYVLNGPGRGDVVVIDSPRPGVQQVLMKRVIAISGEVVEVRGCTVLIDGEPLSEPYRATSADPSCGASMPATTVGQHEIFVLGDARDRSDDSRYFGMVSIDSLAGRVLFAI